MYVLPKEGTAMAQSIAVKQFLYKLRQAFWFIPAFYSFIAIIFALFGFIIDLTLDIKWGEANVPIVILTNVEVGRTLLSALATSILTMTTITFSSILVVLTTYASQFSPRTLQNFIQDQNTQRVLGVFVGGFIYIILALVFIKDTDKDELLFVPSIAVVITIVCLGFFVYFIHYVATSIQVNHLIIQVSDGTLQAIKKTYEEDTKTSLTNEASWKSWEVDDLKLKNHYYIRAHQSGYIQLIHLKELVEATSKHNMTVKIERHIGAYVIEGSVICSYWQHKKTAVDIKEFEQYFTIGNERTTVQDIEFGLQKLVDIALRALSPGVNDPKTAIECIHQLGKLLSNLSSRDMPSPYYYDSHNQLRVIMDHSSFGEYLYTSFYQIRHYSQKDISVLAAIINALILIAEKNTARTKHIIWPFARYIITGFDDSVIHQFDKDYINKKIRHLCSIIGHRYEDLIF